MDLFSCIPILVGQVILRHGNTLSLQMESMNNVLPDMYMLIFVYGDAVLATRFTHTQPLGIHRVFA